MTEPDIRIVTYGDMIQESSIDRIGKYTIDHCNLADRWRNTNTIYYFQHLKAILESMGYRNITTIGLTDMYTRYWFRKVT